MVLRNAEEILKELLNEDHPVHAFCKKYNNLFQYFDNWIVASTNEECTEITGFKIRKKEETHVETIEW